MSQLMKKRFPSITSIDVESDGNTSFLRAARNGQLDKVLEHLKSNIDINTSNANGLNALHLASKDGHVDIVEELLKRGAVVDAATKKGNTALHIASLAGQEEVVKQLVQHGASVNVQSQNGFTPLYMAAQENHDNVVKYLLANGANQSLSTEDGFTPLAVAMQQGHDKVVTVLLENDTRGKIRLPALHIAAKKDDVKAAKLLLENEHNPDVTSKSGFTPLHIASHYGNQQIANLLIQKGADVNYAAKHNITPLHVAAKWGKTSMVTLLLEHGATIESKTRDGLTPLHCAARSGHEQVVGILLDQGAPISSKTKNGLAPLHMAAQGDHVDAARMLLSHRAPVDEVTVDYLTALHVAAHCGHVRVAKLLLDRQADANARALNGFTPLHIACKKNRIKVVELLLKHGASIGATTESGLTPLHVASFMGCMNIVIYLLQHDANPDVPTVRGETPLHLAARANQTDIIRILLRNGAQVDARAREQQTPLHIASRLGNVDIVMLLLQHGAKVDSATKDMYTALHIASKEAQDEVAAVLIDNGASLNSTTKKGFTPLHLAAKYGNLKVASLLLQKETQVDPQGKNGVTPLHVASHYDHQNVALLLLDKGASPHATAKNGHTPLHIAARKNQMDIANTLLEYGAQPNVESKAGFTPLHLSAQEGHADMTSLLIEHKADPNQQAKNGLTPMHLCAQEDRVPVAETLVKNGAPVDTATKAGYTPLHIASHYGQINMVRFLLSNGANVTSNTSLGYTPLHQAAQQGHTTIVNILLENHSDPNAVTANGQTPLNIAQKLGYITVIETLKVVTTTTTITNTTTTNIEEKYKVVAPEAMHETFMSDSEEEGGEDTVLGDQTYRYLTADEMKSLGDDSLPIDVTRDERIDSNRMVSSSDSYSLPPQNIEDNISPEHITQNYVEYIKKYQPANVDIARHPINIGFLVSFLVDARGGAMRGCRHSGVRVIVPPRCAPSPTRITCRYVRPQRTPHPPPLMEGEALASRVLELGPVGAKFLGPVIIEVPHFAALRGKEREIVILRSDNGESWKEHTVEATEEILNEVLHDSFDAEDLSQMEDVASGRITRILTQDFPQYFAVVSRVRQEVHAIGPEGGMVSSTVVPQVQAVFPEGALTKKIKVGLQAQPIDPELSAKLLGHGVAVSPVVTVEPRRRKFHKPITLSMPAPRAHSQGMINQYSGSTPTLRLLCSITGGTSRAQWEDVTGSTPLTFVNDCVSFTTTVSARFWLMDCRNIDDATKMATELYKEAIHVPFMAKFVVFAKRVDPLEARLRVFCMTDDKEDKTLEQQEHFTEVAKSRDVEVLEGKPQYIEFAGNLVPITKSGEQLQFSFRAFRENRLPFSVRVKDQHAEAVSRCLFMKESKVAKGEAPQQPICILNIVLPDHIVTDTISLTDSDSIKKQMFLSENFDYYRPDPRLADMSNLLGEDWVPLANQLGLTTSEINVIKSEYPDSVAKQAQSMLRMWLSQSGNKAQTNTLENALKRIGREDIIPQCLNVDHTGHTFTRIKQEEIGKYRLKKEGSLSKEIRQIDANDDDDDSKHIDINHKYLAEEKIVPEISDEEEDFNKTVTERRLQIEERLSAERTIPASSQRVEIVQEISTIKRQSIVEDKIAEVQQKVTELPASEIVDVKTTKPTDSTVPETKHKPKHKTAEDAELLDGVTQHFETKKPIPKLIAEEDADPKSPKFSKTPPPSPADFLVKEQAASAQELDAPRKQIQLVSPERSIVEEDAVQGIPTSTSQYLASTEESLTGLPIDINNIAVNSKFVTDHTNALIQSESRAEPYHALTEKHYKIHKDDTEDDEKQDSCKTDSLKEEKKQKKGFLGTLKTFVGKSLDHSDSDSEKSGKKSKKTKKDKKKKKKDREVPQELPVRPPRKPKLPTPTEERKEFDDIPFVETASISDEPPHYQPPEVPVEDNLKLPSIPVTDLDENEVPIEIKEQATEIVTEVIKNGEYAVADYIKKSPKKEKRKKVTIVEEKITKTLQPLVIEQEEFTIVIDPTKSETPKKSRETFTLNIDETIGQIESEIMQKSPILSEETILKPLVYDEPPKRPQRVKDHIYEDIDDPVVSHPPDNLVSLPQNIKLGYESADEKLEDKVFTAPPVVTKEEVTVTEKADSQKMKRKHNKLFGLFSKSSKDADDSDEDSRKEIIEKQDKEGSKETEDKKSGFLGMFQKKPKKDEAVAEKPALSDETVKNMNESTDFLLKEVEKYEDVKPITFEMVTKSDIIQETAEKEEAAGKKEKSETGLLGKFKKSKKDDEAKVSKEVEKLLAENEEANLPHPPSENTLLNMITTSKFIQEEVDKYHDVYPVIPEKSAEVIPTAEVKIEEETSAKGGLFGLFAKKKSQEREIEVKKEEKIDPLTEKLIVVEKVEEKVIEKEEEKTTEKPSGGILGIFAKKPKKDKGKRDSSVEKLKETTSPEKKLKSEPVLLVEPIQKTLTDTTNFINTEINNYEDAKIEAVKPITVEEEPATEEITKVVTEKVETETTPKEKEGFFGFFKKDKSPKREPVISTVTTTTVTKEVIASQEPTEKLSEVIGKDIILIEQDIDIKSEQIPKDIESTTEVETKLIPSEKLVKEMSDTTKFISEELTNYEDAKPTFKKELSVEKEKKTGILGLFGKRKSQEREVPDEKPSDEKKDRQERRKSGSPFRIFGKKQKSEEEPKKVELTEETLQHITDSDNFLNQEIESYEDAKLKTITEAENIVPSAPIILSEQTKTEMKESHEFLSTEQSNYEDAKNELVTDLDEDSDVKSSGLFGIFSKKDKKDSPKTTKKKYKKHKHEKSLEDTEKVGFIEKLGRKLASSGSDAKDQIEEATEKMKDEIAEENAKFEAEITDTIKESENIIDGAKSSITKTKESAKQKQVAFKDKTEDILTITDDKITAVITTVEDIQLAADKNVVEAVEEATVSAETQLKNVDAEAEKKKGFFGKLGDKLSGKSEDLKDSVIDTTKSIEEEAVTKKSVITEKVKDVSDEIAQNGSKVIEEITQSTIDTTDSLKRDVLDVTKDSKEIIESTKKDAQKKTKKGFFTKLGGKLSGKSEDLKDEVKDIKVKSDKIEDSIKSEVETAKANLDKDAKEIEGQIKSEITATTIHLEEKAEAVKAESSNFVAEIMDSFDKHLEYVKDEEEDLKKDAEEQVKKRQDAIDTFRQSIDEKFSDTMKLSEEIIEERSHIVKETVSDAKKELDLTIKEELETIDKLDHDTQLQIEKTFTENLEEAAAVPAQVEKKSEDLQKDTAEFIVTETEKLKDETEKASKKSSGFFSKLGDKISGKAKETEKKIADTTKQIEEGIVVAKDYVKKDISDATEKVVDESKQTITRIESKEKEISEQAKDASEAAVKDSKEFISKQTKEGKGFFEKLGVKITGKSKDAQKAVESVKDDVVKATTESSTDVDNKIKKQSKDLRKEESKIVEQAAEIQKDGNEAIEKVATEIKEDYTTVEAAVTGTVSDTLDKAVTAKDNLKQDLIDVETKGKENLQAVKDASDDAVKDSKEFIGKQAKESKGFFEKISDKISGKSKDAQKATETAKDDLIKAATDIDDKVKKQTDELVKAEAKLVEKSVEIQKDGKEAMDKVAADVKEEAKKEYTAAETALTESVSVTLDQTTAIKDDLKESIQLASEQTKQISEKAIKDSQELITKQTKETKGFFEKIGEKISGKSKDAQKATESVKEDLTKAATIVDDKVKEQTEILIKEEAKVVEKAAEIQKESREAMEKIAADAKDELKQAETIITEKVSVTVDQAKSIKESLKEDLINIETQGKENIQLVSQQTKEAVKESEELISKQLKETKDTITTVVTEQISDPAQEMLKKSKEVADKQAEEGKEIFEKMGDKISDKSKDVQKSAEVLAADLTKSADETLIKIDDKIEHHKEQLKKEEDKLVEEAAQMKENTKQALEDVKSSFTDKLNSLSGKVDEENKEADKKIQDLKDAVKDSNLLLQEEILVKDEELNEAINNRVSEILVDVSTKKKEIETILLEEAHATKIVPEQLLTQSQKSLQAKGDTIKSAIKSAITKKTSLSDKAKEGLLETAEKTETTTIEASKVVDEAEEKVEKVSKKSKSFLGKLGRKLSGKGDELKPKKQPEVKQEETKQESEKKSKKGAGFFGKLGEKLSSKTDDVKQDVTEVQDIAAAAEEKLVVKVEQVKQEAASLKDQATDAVQKIEKELEKKSEELQTKAENVEKVLEQKNSELKTKIEDVEKEFKATVSTNVKQQTSDFLDDLRDNAMTRTISDNYGLADNQSSDTMKVSEANIDLSNLPTNLNKYPHTSQKHDSSSYVTSPTLARRTVSQRLSTGERPAFIELTNLESDLSDTDDSYIVTEPEEKPMGKIPVIQGIIDNSRKPLFHFDSEEDDSYDQGKLQERRASVQSNVLDSLTEHKIDNLLSDLTKNLDDATCSSTKVPIIKEEEKLEQHVLEAKVDVDIIEQKLRDLDQALDSLEQIEVVVSNIKDDEAKSEKKLRRVERKFERMASQTMDKEKEQAKAEKLSTPEVEEKRETEFQRLVSQLSTEEVSDFQKEYSHLWDENTFSKSEDWESTKTPDSQADAQDLPQGEGTSATTQHQQEPRRSSGSGGKAETEEGHGPAKSQEHLPPKSVSDQHQLSDEMKQLLQELEKESKQ